MLSFTKVPTHFFISPPRNFNELDYPFHHSLISSNFFEINSRIKKVKLMSVLQFVNNDRESCLFGFLELKKDCCPCLSSGFVRKCSNTDWKSDSGDSQLEAEIFEFMINSEKPEAFPSKKELINAGRIDLVEAILKQGGWLASGWDLDDDDDDDNDSNAAIEEKGTSSDDNLMSDDEFRNDGTSFEERSHDEVVNNGGAYAPATSSSGRSIEGEADNDSGIEGILSRLERKRNINFGFGLSEREGNVHAQVNDVAHDSLAKSSKNLTLTGLERNSQPGSSSSNNGTINDSKGNLGYNRLQSNIDGFGHSLKRDAWRMWSNMRAGGSEMEFEADEFVTCKISTQGEMDTLGEDSLEKRVVATESLNKSGENPAKFNEIRNRLQHLESELLSVLDNLKSNTSENELKKEGSSDLLVKLSDAWEFQENEIMKSQDRLRSIRAKLAVLEGKMALAMIESQKIVEEKQKRVYDAHKALQLLRTACIVWTNSASEVLLAGSFDGWTTKRKMQKSSVGIFSLCMKLYPGKYEIKFIVDGEWNVDPQRPVVRNGGHDNNLLIIT